MRKVDKGNNLLFGLLMEYIIKGDTLIFKLTYSQICIVI